MFTAYKWTGLSDCCRHNVQLNQVHSGVASNSHFFCLINLSRIGAVKMPGRPRSARPPAAGQKRKRGSSPIENSVRSSEKQKNLARKKTKDDPGSLKQLTNGNPADLDLNAGGDSKSAPLDKFKYIPKGNKLSSHQEQSKEKSKPPTKSETNDLSTLDDDNDIFAQIFKATQALHSSADTIKNKLTQAVQPYCPQSVNVVHSLTQHSYGSRCPSTLKKVTPPLLFRPKRNIVFNVEMICTVLLLG